MAGEQPDVFSKFRSNFDYLEILDHVTYSQGLQYLSLLDEKLIKKVNESSWFCIFSDVGLPQKYSYPHFKCPCSPTIFRYIKVAEDLRSLFGITNGLKLGEIGIGYGGQTLVLDKLGMLGNLAWFDLPDVMKLSSAFISKFDLHTTPQHIDGRNPSYSKLDLVISNYAFSELSRAVQESYLSRVIANSARGYITWNVLSEQKLDGYKLAEFLNVLPNPEVFPEHPSTFPGNCIIAWGHTPGMRPIA
jgi:hypothetical protein